MTQPVSQGGAHGAPAKSAAPSDHQGLRFRRARLVTGFLRSRDIGQREFAALIEQELQQIDPTELVHQTRVGRWERTPSEAGYLRPTPTERMIVARISGLPEAWLEFGRVVPGLGEMFDDQGQLLPSAPMTLLQHFSPRVAPTYAPSRAVEPRADDPAAGEPRSSATPDDVKKRGGRRSA